jgi:hypothetical protein
MSNEPKTVEIEVRTVDLEGPKFWPKYRKVIQMKEVLMRPMNATVDDVDAAFEFLLDHVVKPEDQGVKREILENLEGEQLIKLFDQIVGGAQTAVPPSNGAVSENTSDS